MFPERLKTEFTANCLNIFVPHCTSKKILYYILLT